MKTQLRKIDYNLLVAPNKCDWISNEKLFRSVQVPDGPLVRVYAGSYNQYRALAIVDGRAVAGVLLDPDGTIALRVTLFDYQGNHITHTIIKVLKRLNIEVYKSQFLTDAGAACYKSHLRAIPA